MPSTPTPPASLVPPRIRSSSDEGIVMHEKEETRGAVTRPKRRLSRAHSASTSPPPSPAPSGSFSSLLQQQQQRSTAQTTTASVNATASFSRPGKRIDENKQQLKPPPLTLELPSYAPLGIQKEQPPKLFGIELKWISLVTLSLQNAFLAIIMHYSRISTAPSQTYSAAAAVLMNEMLKCAISSLIALKRIDNSLWEHQRLSDGHKRGFTMFHKSRLAALRRNIFSSDCYKLAMPAILYVVQNNLQYVAISNLDVATFQVTNQMKILTTAFFSVLMLGKRLSRARWGALVLLAVGVCIVQLQTVSNTATTDGRLVGRVMHPMRGFLAVTLASVTSGIAGVYFELLVKSNGSTDLWTRNTQLSLFSLLPALMPILFSPHPGVSWSAGVASRFANFNGWAIGTVLTQTFGGLLTAIVIRYSDNILKGFATSLSIVISFLASVVLFNYTLTAAFLVGASIVLAATWMYNSPTAERTSVAVAPGSPIPSSAPILGEHKKRNSIVDMLRSASTSASDYVPAARLPPPLSRTPSSTPSTPYHSSPAQSYIGLSELRKPIVGVNTLLGGK